MKIMLVLWVEFLSVSYIQIPNLMLDNVRNNINVNI